FLRAQIAALRATRVPHARGFAAVIQAGLDVATGSPEHATRQLADAIECFDHNGLRMHAAAARRRLAPLLGGSAASCLRRASDTTMQAEAIHDLDATTDMLAPAFKC
ncbi:MAG TPA: hypothetical protein VJV78_09080, partial [Polyangiales bacterium]|nr:hypothetical protein [Polyangiales bacterium]